jgi:hypothetical protein
MLTPRQVIDDIRSSQYGIGLPGDSASTPVIASMRSKLDRALKLLSTDLYAKDIHFVLELLQNAEDNSYASGVEPEVRFILTNDAILVQNNEVGFSEENIRSICDVANSSKKKRLGYIGEKGIGFKSVFRVTDEPLIISNGFRFSLPIYDPDTGLGYVIPVWRQNNLPPGIDPSWTNIYLPLTFKGREELPRVADIYPSLLLFLKKVRKIDIRDANGNSTNSIVRKQVGGSVSIESSVGTDYWRVISHSLSVPNEIIEEKREGVTAVELTLAFPMTEEGTPDPSVERPVYSFLPIRPYGFRFAIQGDFILASSREDILTDRVWNQWLRDSIPSLFMSAVELFKADKTLRTTFLAVIPSSAQVTDPFFGIIPNKIIELLKENDCILTVSGQWAKPSEVLSAYGPVRELLTNDDIKTHVGKELVNEAFQADSKTLQLLGVALLSFDDLVKCLSDTEWVASKGDSWLLRMFAYLNSWNWTDAGRRTIRSIRLIPLENGHLESSAGGQIFLPLDRRTTYGFEEDLRIVRRDLFKAADGPIVEPARKFLRASLGVRTADPLEIINEHILPVFESGDEKSNWKSKNAEFTLGAIEYIKDHFAQYVAAGGSPDRLKTGLYIKFVHPDGIWYTKTTDLYLPKSYGDTIDLEGLFEGIEGIHFVDNVYLEHSLKRHKQLSKQATVSEKRHREIRESWRAFFLTMGVETTIRVSHPANATPEQVASPHLTKLISTGDNERISKALNVLDINWARYRPNLEIERFYVQRNQRYSSGKSPTAFCTQIRSARWIPTKGHGLCQPRNVFLDVEANRSVFGEHVAYLGIDLRNRDFINDLGVRSGPTVDSVLSCLIELAGKQHKDVNLFRRLYRFLDVHFTEGAAEILAAFQGRPLIYIPAHPGQFLRSTDVFWKDISSLFGERRGYLSRSWNGLKEFFVDKLGVAFTPLPQDYVDLLKELSQKPSLTDDDECRVWEAYRELERRLAQEQNDEGRPNAVWWNDFVTSGLYWTDRHQFWKDHQDVYVNDQEEYRDLFSSHGDCAYLKLPENQFPSFRHLIEAAGLRKMSESVRVMQVTPLYAQQEIAITRVLRDAAPFIVRYLYFKENEIYRECEASGTLRQMRELSFSICDELDVVLEFRGSEKRVARDAAGEFPQLFAREDVDDPIDRIGVILAKHFRNPRGLDSFICLLLTKKSKIAMERLMEAQGIPAMPPDVLQAFAAAHQTDDKSLSDESSPDDWEMLTNVEYSPLLNSGDSGSEHDGWSKESPDLQPRDQTTGANQRPSTVSGWNASEEVEIGGKGHSVSHNRGGVDEQSSQSQKQRDDSREQGRSPDPHNEQRESDRESGGGQSGESSRSRNRSNDSTLRHRERSGRNWFRVLGSPGDSAGLAGGGNSPPNDDLARQKVVEYEVRRGRPATAAPSNQEGYDVSSDDPHRGVRRLIEVKGLQTRWTGDATVTLTGPQFDASRAEPPTGCEYWLYVVDGLGTDSPRIHPIHRFAAKVERVYLQAEDWLSEIDQADRNRLSDDAVERLRLPIIDFASIAEQIPTSEFITRYPNKNLMDLVPVGGFLKCVPLDSDAPLPPKGKLVMLLPGQVGNEDSTGRPLVGELRWSIRQSLEGESQYAEVSLRPKTADPDAKPVSFRILMMNWPSFRPYAVCEPLAEV